jgi:hypothetical protein
LAVAYLGDEGKHEVQAGLSPGVEHGATALVDSDVASVDDVEGAGEVEGEDGEDCVGRLVHVKTNAETTCDIRYVINIID